ncbi:MAG: cysteine synthase family protein [Chlamydiia bacterium]|nr:cysteine synthase family protein [Chlamydiia bacterium]
MTLKEGKLPTVIKTIGNTPLVRLKRMNPFSLVTILLKLEFFNPSGSIKDRIVAHIVDDAQMKGLIKPGGVLIEATSGNTGAAAAMIAAIRGYKAVLTLPDKVSKEKQDALRAFGAELIICPTSAPPDSPEHYVNKAKAIKEKTPGSFRIDQYDNLKNPEAHYLTTGPEIWEQSRGEVDYLIASASTGGTISGTGRYLKEKNPNLKLIMPDPVGSIYAEYFKTGRIPKEGHCNYLVEGVGEDHLAKALDFSIIDEVIPFTDKEAFDTCRRLAKEEGILAGGSSGGNLKIALDIAKKLTRPKTLVVIIPDGGLKYLSKIYNDEWMKEKGLL